VSYDATGFAIYDSIAINGVSGWMTATGTSAGAPQWAALLAIADQGRTALGKANLTDAVSAIYGLPASDFHDVTTGGNGALRAGAGYDLVTGRGSPYADRVVSGLVGPAPTPTAPAPVTTPTLNLAFIASKLATFLQQTTGSAAKTAIAVPAAIPSPPTSSAGSLAQHLDVAALGLGFHFLNADAENDVADAQLITIMEWPIRR